MGDELGNSSKVNNEENLNQDELILQQQRQIEKEISESIPLIGELEPLSSLENEYTGDDVYQLKIKDLASKYKAMRRTRPDGNCFFRAFSYAYIERLIDSKKDYEDFTTFAQNSKSNLVTLGFSQFTVEDFHDTFMEVIQKIGSAASESLEKAKDELHKLFNEQGYSDYMVVYLRLLASGQLQEECDFYQHFIEGGRTVEEFCHQEVEPMYKESDHIHIIAICNALFVGVRVIYMDRGEGGQVIEHEFPEAAIPSVHLLYRPGHYDILYPL